MKQFSGSPVLTESLQTNKVLQDFPPAGGPVVIEYWQKPGDPREMIDALLRYWKASGFQPQLKPGLNLSSANVVWYRGPIALPDLKRVALSLIRVGLPVRAIKQLATPGPDKVQVGYDPEFSDLPIWLVSEIQSAKDFTSPRASTPLAYLAIDYPEEDAVIKAYDFLNSRAVVYKVTLTSKNRISTIATSLMSDADAKKLQGTLNSAGLKFVLRKP